jgi:hypothetical protein
VGTYVRRGEGLHMWCPQEASTPSCLQAGGWHPRRGGENGSTWQGVCVCGGGGCMHVQLVVLVCTMLVNVCTMFAPVVAGMHPSNL